METKQRQTHIFRLNKDRHIDEDRTRNKFMDVEKSEAKIERTCALILHQAMLTNVKILML